MSVQAKRESVTVDRLTVRTDRNWAIVTLEEATGLVHIDSDLGRWSYRWPPGHRSGTLDEFLRSAGPDYLGDKLLSKGFLVVSGGLTATRARQAVIEHRRIDYFNKYEARREWQLAEDLDNDDDVNNWMAQTRLPDAWDYIRHEHNPVWMAFWERLWVPHLRPLLKT